MPTIPKPNYITWFSLNVEQNKTPKMKTIEKILVSVIVLSGLLHLFKIVNMHVIRDDGWNGYEYTVVENDFGTQYGEIVFILFFCSFLALSTIYFYLSFLLLNDIGFRKVFNKESYKNLSTYKIISSIILGLGYSTIIIGILFKLQLWPGSTTILLIGIIISISIFITNIIKSNSKLSKKTIIRFSTLLIFGILFLFISDLSVMEFKLNQSKIKYPKYAEAYFKFLENQTDDSLYELKEIEYYKILYPDTKFKDYNDVLIFQDKFERIH